MDQAEIAVRSSVSNTEFDSTDKKLAIKYIRIGYAIIFLFVGSVVAWSAYAPISSAAVAAGLVSKDGYSKTIQHLEGGIIDKILVKDGDKVRSNQELIHLKDIQSRSDVDLLEKQKLIALTKEACLLAELNNRESLPPNFLPGINIETVDDFVRGAIDGHIKAFHVRRASYNGQLGIIDQRINQAKVKIKALAEERRALGEEGNIIAQEKKKYEELKKKGLVTRANVFSLKKDEAENETDKTANRVSTESTRQEINNLEMEKIELTAGYSKRVVSDLDSVRGQLVDLDVKLTKTDDRLERTVIRAPIDGVVVNLQVNTVGGVVKSGEPLLDIVPEAGKLIIEAQVDPSDRDTVRVGQNAEVLFTAFNQRITEPVQGKVVLISADRLVDIAADGKPKAYYGAKIELVEDPSEVLNGVPVYPGMQAEVMIITGERTALQYFMKPIVKSFNRSFRDD